MSRLLHAIDATPPRWRVAHRQRRKQPPVAPDVADALARRGLGRLVASTIAPPVAPEVKRPPEDDGDLECGICLSLLTDPVHTPCLHIFCRTCVKQALSRVTNCVEINQCVGCTRQFFTKSFLGDDAADLARSSGEEPASPRHRAGVASMAWRTTR